MVSITPTPKHFSELFKLSELNANLRIVVESVYGIDLAFFVFDPKATRRGLSPLQRYMKETKGEEPWHVYNLRSDTSPDLRKGTTLSQTG